jgi:hypothetical protein
VDTNGYVVVGPSNDYKTSLTSALNQSSTLVSDIDCLKAGGTTAYATAIDQAQSVLAANHSSTAQDAIIFFADGEADYGPCVDANNDSVCDNNSSTYRSRPYYQAQQSASVAKTAGTWIYTVLYDTTTTTPVRRGSPPAPARSWAAAAASAASPRASSSWSDANDHPLRRPTAPFRRWLRTRPGSTTPRTRPA